MRWRKPYDEQVDKMPRRFFWTKFIGIMLVVCLAATTGMRIWWGWHAQTRLQRAIDAIKAAGEPVTPADLAAATPRVDPKDDCMRLYRQANDLAKKVLYDRATTLPTDGNTGRDWCNDLTASRELRMAHAARVGDILARGAEALALARRARGLQGTSFNTDYSKPMIEMLPAIPIRELRTLLSLATVDAADRSQDDQAMEYLRDMLILGDRQITGPDLFSLLAGRGIVTEAVTQLESILPNLRAGSAGAAPREQVEAMVRHLLDDSALRPAFYRAMCWERVRAINTAEGVINDSGTFEAKGGWLPALILRPTYVMDEAIALDSVWSFIVECARQRDYPALKSMHHTSPLDERMFESDAHKLLSVLVPEFARAGRANFMAIATRRLAATALAIHLYETDHGALPTSLDQLVPAYLPSVPVDPFSPTHAPIRYASDGHPRVYSVYVNGTDDHGATDARSPADGLDIVFFIKGGRPGSESAVPTSRPSSSQGTDHHQP